MSLGAAPRYPHRVRRYLLSLLLLPSACGDDEPVDPSRTPIELNFEARSGAVVVGCDSPITSAGIAGPLELRDFRLYVSNLRAIGPDGAEVPVELAQDGTWQNGDVALLDFEDGSGACSATGNPATRSVIEGQVELEDVRGVVFDIGVPFERNHLDASTAPSPLNVTSMYWNWRAGYKFARIDLRDTGATPPMDFNIHLGSTGCESAAPVEGPTEPCARPNRPEVRLEDFDPAQQLVVLDLEGLLNTVDTSTNTAETPPGCMSGPTDPDDCTPLFQNLGMDFATGNCAGGDCSNQRFVRGI